MVIRRLLRRKRKRNRNRNRSKKKSKVSSKARILRRIRRIRQITPEIEVRHPLRSKNPRNLLRTKRLIGPRRTAT
ncbi:hypothetical protein D3C81_1355740 [compost metagenome]